MTRKRKLFVVHPTTSHHKYWNPEGIVMRLIFGALVSLFTPWSTEDLLSNLKMSKILIKKSKNAPFLSQIISPLLSI